MGIKVSRGIINYDSESLQLAESFHQYLAEKHKYHLIPKGSNIVFFMEDNSELNKGAIVLLEKLISEKQKTIEVTRTKSRTLPWRVAQTFV